MSPFQQHRALRTLAEITISGLFFGALFEKEQVVDDSKM
jgi:hypothetical protein